jgi:Uma2 family endonuclease
MEFLEVIPKTALDVFRLLPEGTLCEVIDNILYMSPAPKYTHQRLVLLLARKLSNHVEAYKIGEIFIAPVDVYFVDLASAVQPALLFVANKNRGIMHQDGYIYGAPDIVIEVLSSDRKRDLVLKKGLYQRAGVKEYFIVDPATRKMQLYSLSDGSYQLVYDETGLFTSPLLSLEFTF